MIVVPPTFRDMPRWRYDVAGREWLDRLPDLVDRQCDRWRLDLDGVVVHGSNALVVPVRREEERAVLRLAPPGDDVSAETAALAHWDGRGVVRLLDADVGSGASLLERLDPTRTLQTEPVHEAIATLGTLTRVLAVPAPADAPRTRDIAAEATTAFPAEWEALAGPTPPRALDAAVAAASVLGSTPDDSVSVNGDLHFAQVLAGGRLPWTVVDPVLLRGDPEYDIGRVLWSRLDELDSDAAVFAAFDAFVDAAGVPPERARRWVLVRSMSYLLWGLRRGLTLDPPKCVRLLELFG
ncbi:aminoglycoside phosphotransferase family protein [Microbacterium sp. NPDC058062]|uniref:aminoglycoside phosphotransferase family protein n=1 Tax=Microbacterium sp. NPDC058062 TaxID=3346320 RepID=UPI0036DEC08A